MFAIDINSEAGRELARVMSDKDTYKVSLEYRPSKDGGEFVAIKRNEAIWSPSLSTVTPMYPAHSER